MLDELSRSGSVMSDTVELEQKDDPRNPNVNPNRKGKQSGGNVPIKSMISNMFQRLDDMEMSLASLRYPNGSRTTPALSCKEIQLSYKAFTVGWYWIDPNGGSKIDAIQVFCNMSGGGETCVYPKHKSRMVMPQSWPVTPQLKLPTWFSEMDDGFRFDYASKSQMKVLRFLSTLASQDFTYFCVNSVAWYSRRERGYDKAAVLRGINGHLYHTERFASKQVPFDGCRSSNQRSSHTKFSISAKRVENLPITDLLSRDYGKPWQKFGFEIGPVCFK